jgi:hypothetical protein
MWGRIREGPPPVHGGPVSGLWPLTAGAYCPVIARQRTRATRPGQLLLLPIPLAKQRPNLARYLAFFLTDGRAVARRACEVDDE